ncbi:Cell death protein 4 [Toxocara canis]|uniref:Cell death protein 4 n=1 Tax=Toxocara canis TaxID=6265 RepID=A0A0B2UY73_TOXCA|nr:Cell death protein 4 [Toxocara canis]
MLQERDSRTLSVVMDALIRDFEPREAVPYMAAKLIFTDDQRDAILNMPRRRTRVLEFVRQYRRSASNLDALISFFEHYGQFHLATALSTTVVPEERSLLSEHNLHTCLLRESNVPGRLKNYVKREELIENLRFILRDLASTEQFWLVVHGMAGCGKSSLVAEALRSCPEILSRYYEHVIWIHDGRSSRDSLPSLYADFFVIVADSLVITGREPVTLIQAQVKNALLDKPNALIVLDDVMLEESVRWFDQLQCRILATSRNLEIFQASYGNVVPFRMTPSGFTISELTSFLAGAGFQNVDCDVIQRMHNLSSGLPAMANIIVHLARGSVERLGWLCYQLESASLGSLKCVTSYRYASMEEAIQTSFEMLALPQKEVFTSLVVFPVDEWLPVEVISLIAPVDVTDHEESIYATEEQLETLAKHSLLDERQAPQQCKSQFEYRIHPLVGAFLRRTLLKESPFVEELRSILKLRLRSFIEESTDERTRMRVVTFSEHFLRDNCLELQSEENVISMGAGDHQMAAIRLAQARSKLTTMSSAAASGSAQKKKKRRSRNSRHSHNDSTRAPVVMFSRVKGRPEMARLQLLLMNVDERQLKYKVKIKEGCTVTALPSGVGQLDAHASTRVMLIWRRPPDIDDWSKVKPAVLLLVGEYGDDDKPESKRRIIQRMNGYHHFKSAIF